MNHIRSISVTHDSSSSLTNGSSTSAEFSSTSSSSIQSSSSTLSIYSPVLTNGVLCNGESRAAIDMALFKLNKNYNLVDALPYIDPLNEEVEGQVKALIEEEMKNILNENENKMKNYLETIPMPETPHLNNQATILGQEFNRCAAGKPMPKLDMSLYSSLESLAPNRENDIAEWNKSIESAQCLLEHSHTAIMNLELMINFAKDVWLKHIADLELQEKTLSGEVSKNRQESEDVNKKRKLDQMSCANTLRNLNNEKNDIVERNKKILSALEILEGEIFEMRKQCIKKGVMPENIESVYEDQEEQ